MAGIEIRNLRAAYDKADVLHDVSIDVVPGKITCLLGSNGAGKSTLIRAILGLTPPNAGTIKLEGEDTTGIATHKGIARGIAAIPEGRRTVSMMSVTENMRQGAIQVIDDALTRQRIDTVFDLVPPAADR